MNTNYDLKSILSAIDEINIEKKDRIFFSTSNKVADNYKYNDVNKKYNDVNKEILPTTEKLILEAENYSKKFKDRPLTPKLNEEVLVLDNEYNEQNLKILNLEEIKLNVINDLHSSNSKKIKKNTLKIIFDLREKIYDLEKKIKHITKKNYDKDLTQYVDKNNLDKNEEHLIDEDILQINERNIFKNNKNTLSEDIIKTLRQLNSSVKDFEKNEEKLRLKIVDLEQDLSILKKDK